MTSAAWKCGCGEMNSAGWKVCCHCDCERVFGEKVGEALAAELAAGILNKFAPCIAHGWRTCVVNLEEMRLIDAALRTERPPASDEVVERVKKAVMAITWRREQYNSVGPDYDNYRAGARYDMGGRVEAYEREAERIARKILALPEIAAAGPEFKRNLPQFFDDVDEIAAAERTAGEEIYRVVHTLGNVKISDPIPGFPQDADTAAERPEPSVEALVEMHGEALFALSARLQNNGFLDIRENSLAYERVVETFTALAPRTGQGDA